MDYVSTLCCSLAFLLYYNTLDAGFVYDDRRAILTNPDLLPSTPWTDVFYNDFWGTPMTDSGSHGSYRPLSVLTFRLNYFLGGLEPFGYHLGNVLLHVLATALFIRISRRILPKSLAEATSAIAGLLFAVHPIHTEAVAAIVGRADLLSAITFMLSFLAYVAHVRNRNVYFYVPESSTPQYDLRFLKKWQKDILKSTSIKILKKSAELTISTQRKKTLFVYFKMWFYLLLCLILSVVSMLCKETGISVLGCCFVYDLVITSYRKQKQWRSLLILGATTLVALATRFYGGITPDFARADNPTAKEDCVLTRFLTFSYLPVFNFLLMLYPYPLSFDWGMEAVPRLKTVFDPRNCITSLFYLSGVWTLIYCFSKLNPPKEKMCLKHKMVTIKTNQKNRRETVTQCVFCHETFTNLHSSSCRNANNNNSWNLSCECTMPSIKAARNTLTFEGSIVVSLALLAIPFLPATNILFYVGFVVAERVLYLPSAGLCLLFGLAGAALWHRSEHHKKSLLIVLSIVLMALGTRTVWRNADWYDEEALYSSAVTVNPPKALGNLGSILSSAGRMAEAEAAYREALVYKPNMADVHYNLGILLQAEKRLDEAILSYQRAIHFRSTLALAYINLASALVEAKRSEEAVAVLNQASTLDGTGLKDRRQHESAKVSALLQLGDLYSDQGRLHRALEIYTEAASNIPDHYPRQKVFNVLGKTLHQLKRHEEAERWYRAALHAQPDHVASYIGYGKLIARNVSRSNEAEQWFRKAQKIAPNDPAVYHNYGEFLVYRHQYKEAADMYEKAAELSPDDYQLAVAAAIAMRQAGRPHDAERWYRQAVALKPSDAQNLSNLGAILHLNGKYKEAAKNYRASLKIEPNDAITLTNLNRLHSLMT